MTWQGGKHRPAPPASPFACLAPLVRSDRETGLDASVRGVATALKDAKAKVTLHVRYVSPTATGEKVDHWEVGAGKAKRGKPKTADIVLEVTAETWLEIVRGRLAPYDAVFGGQLRVGGDLEAAKKLVESLSDPSVPYVAPC